VKDASELSPAQQQALAAPWINSASYWIPEYIVESAWLEHAPFSAWLISELRPESIVELGTHHGFSYFAFCDFARRLELPTKFLAIDTWEGDEHAGFYGEEVFAAVSEWNRLYATQSTLVRSRFDVARTGVHERSVDLLHIDGRHRYEDVSEDFELYLPTMSSRGVVLFHDIAERSGDFGVYRFWDELKQRYPTFEFEHGHGLGVAFVGIEMTQTLLTLAGADELTSEAIRQTYATLGARTTDIRRLLARTAEAEVLELRAGALELQLGQNSQLLEDLRRQLLVAEEDREQLADRVAAYGASTSWRITAPFRWFSGAARRFLIRKTSA
jgi:hypothetical protein